MKLTGIIKAFQLLQVADVGLAVEVVPVPGRKLKGNPLFPDDSLHKDVEGGGDGKPNFFADAGEFRLVVAVQSDSYVCHGLPPEKATSKDMDSFNYTVKWSTNQVQMMCFLCVDGCLWRGFGETVGRANRRTESGLP